MSSTSSTKPNGSAPLRAATNDCCWRYLHEHGPDLRDFGRTGSARLGTCMRRVSHPARPEGSGPRCRVRQSLCERHAARPDLRHPIRKHPLLRGRADDRAARFREHRRPCQVLAAWRGDRMNAAGEISALAAILTAVLLIGGAAITL